MDDLIQVNANMLLHALKDLQVEEDYYVDLQDNGDYKAPLWGVNRNEVMKCIGADAELMDLINPDWFIDSSWAIGNSLEKSVDMIVLHISDGYRLVADRAIDVPKEISKTLFEKLYKSSPNEFALDVITF